MVSFLKNFPRSSSEIEKKRNISVNMSGIEIFLRAKKPVFERRIGRLFTTLKKNQIWEAEKAIHSLITKFLPHM